jgi:hypothetical protein
MGIYRSHERAGKARPSENRYSAYLLNITNQRLISRKT